MAGELLILIRIVIKILSIINGVSKIRQDQTTTEPFVFAYDGSGTSANLDVEFVGQFAFYLVKAVNTNGSSSCSDSICEYCGDEVAE